MNRLQHKFHARRLIGECGGLAAAAAALVNRKGCAQRLGEYQNPNHDAVMPADVIWDLEQFCGKRIYSRALFQSGPDEGTAEECALNGALEATEAVVDLQQRLRLATKDGQLSMAEGDAALHQIEQAREQLDEVARTIRLGRGQ
ncbi:hypothetical protein [Brevundimonas sp.]|uniref:hypothetical protein n=1 Tax=Brevundimonas sp. TaxID=1871086 RepID=UPI002D34B197|nr:hypothetical protein [Brevundimonas sp.]HYD26923.1 hypothetical protein [Brevundimonas sp.]